MNLLDRIRIGIKAITQLGLIKVWNYGLYQAGLGSGYYRLRSPTSSRNTHLPSSALQPRWFFKLPDHSAFLEFGEDYIKQVANIGKEIIECSVRLFGSEPVDLNFEKKYPPGHWTDHEKGNIRDAGEDIKFIWEPARFGWAIELGKSFYLTSDEKFAGAFLDYFHGFSINHPLNTGPNWRSGQEVALRLIALVITAHLLKRSEKINSDQFNKFFVSIADHSDRILLTLPYAKAQNNNHLISEAVGLFTAGIFLDNHPRSEKWKTTGRKLFRYTILNQIDENGEYCQHSTNYHRMMLMLALWMKVLLEAENKDLKKEEYLQLGKTVMWLTGQFDEISGKATNLGHNDGSFILPFSNGEFSDYRPVLQAAGCAFLKKQLLPPGHWDDLSLWMHLQDFQEYSEENILASLWPKSRIGVNHSWAILRNVNYRSRPAHADQLHVDLWLNGVNLLKDAGTYLYNAPPPWENALASTKVHNTIFIDGKDQMIRAGRFLWLDWAQSKILKISENRVIAEHDGYQSIGVNHQRELRMLKNTEWLIHDSLIPVKNQPLHHEVMLQWLLPDCPYLVYSDCLEMNISNMKIQMQIEKKPDNPAAERIIFRAGQPKKSIPGSSNFGWFSPTYAKKIPALSIIYHFKSEMPVEIFTRISLV